MAFIPQADFMIGPYSSGSGAMQNVEVNDDSMTYAFPHFIFKPYSKQIQLGDGSVRGAGWVIAEWNWDIISSTQRDWLRGFIPGQSAEVWIKTRTMDNSEEYKVYHAIAIWPIDSEEHDVHRRPKFAIKFQRLTLT